MKMIIGLDIHSKQTVYVAQDESGKVVGSGKIVTTQAGFSEMLEELNAPDGTRIGLETGTQAILAARWLLELGTEPVVIDAREVRNKARRAKQKSDSRDAFEICDGLRRDIYTSIVWVPPPAIERLRRILSRRRHFVGIRTSQINAAKFLLRSSGYNHFCRSLGRPLGWQILLSEAKRTPIEQHLRMHQQMWKLADEMVKELEKELKEALKPFSETIELLRTMPGVGLITAATYLAVLGTPDRFPTSGNVISYIGLVPAGYDSGDKIRRGHITRQGSAEMRAMLAEAAHHARSPSHPLHPYFARDCAKNGYKRAVTNVAQRMARILYRMWRDGERFDVGKLNVEYVGAKKTKTVYYRIGRTTDVTVSI
jgi:transposase